MINLFSVFFFQYFVFDFHMAPAMLFDKIITLTVSDSPPSSPSYRDNNKYKHLRGNIKKQYCKSFGHFLVLKFGRFFQNDKIAEKMMKSN